MSATATVRASLGMFVGSLLGVLGLGGCAAGPPARKEPLTQQRPLSSLLEAAAYPNSDTLLVLLTMQQLSATHREWEGYAYYGRLADQQPARRALYRSLQAVMQARVANDVPLLRRVAWVEDMGASLLNGAVCFNLDTVKIAPIWTPSR